MWGAQRISTPSAGDADAHSDHLPLGLRHNLAPRNFIHYLLCSAAPMRTLELHFDSAEMLLILAQMIKYWHNTGP